MRSNVTSDKPQSILHHSWRRFRHSDDGLTAVTRLALRADSAGIYHRPDADAATDAEPAGAEADRDDLTGDLGFEFGHFSMGEGRFLRPWPATSRREDPTTTAV